MSKGQTGLSIELGLLGLLAILISASGAIATEASSPLSLAAVEDSRPLGKTKETSQQTSIHQAVFNPTDTTAPALTKPAVIVDSMPDDQPSVGRSDTVLPENQTLPSPAVDATLQPITPIDSVYAADLTGAADATSAQAIPITATSTTCLAVDLTSEKCWVARSPQTPLNLMAQTDTNTTDEASDDEPSPWRFEFEPYLFIPFSIEADITIGDNAEVNRAFLIDQLTDRILEALEGRVTGDRITGDRIENAVEDALDCDTNCLPDILPDLVGDELQIPIDNALRERIETRVESFLDRFSEGTVPVEVNADLGLSDFLEFNFDQLLWLAGRFELWYGDVGIFTQNAVSKIGLFDDETDVDIDIDIDLFGGEAGFIWRVGTTSLRNTEVETNEILYPTLTLDLIGGVRYGDVTQTVDFDPGPAFELEADWLEPMVGTRIALALSDDLALAARAETSLIGEGGTTENWEVLLGVNWRLSENFYLRPAYRIYSIGFTSTGSVGTSSLNLTAQGLWLGFTFVF